ncbi:MAG TPA: hypothetical protein VII52_14490 [Gemmatimonadaceae bacterium]
MRSSLAVLAVSVGCSSTSGGASPEAKDASPSSGTDGTATEAAAEASPSGGSPSDVDANTNDAPSLHVSECEALATTFVQSCQSLHDSSGPAPDTERMCIWTAYGHLCRTGNTQLLVDSMNCFGSNVNCWTFSDSNNAAACLASVHATGESEAVRTLLQNVCTSCGSTNCAVVTGQAELIPYVSDDEVAALASCGGTACTNAAFVANCTSVPDVAAIFSCK